MGRDLNNQNIGGLVQERRNSIANALELRPSNTNPSIWMQPHWSAFLWRMGILNFEWYASLVGSARDHTGYGYNVTWSLSPYTEWSLACVGQVTLQRKRGCNVNHIDGLVQERRDSSALAMELRLSCTKPSLCHFVVTTPNKLFKKRMNQYYLYQ